MQAVNFSALGVVYRKISFEFVILRASPQVSPANIKWTFNDTNGSSRDITNTTDGRLKFSDNMQQLTISNISMSDEGRYTLTATNPAGEGSGVVSLNVEGNVKIIVNNNRL